MLNKILFATLEKATKMSALHSDIYEQASQYKGYILPVRYSLAIRYLKHKCAVLDEFREEGIFPPPENEFKTRLLDRLVKKNTSLSSTLSLLSPSIKAWFLYPLLLAALAVSTWLFKDWIADQRLAAMLANRLPYYSDLLHRSLMFKYSGYEEAYKQVTTEIAKEKEHILSQLPDDKPLHDAMEKGLTRMGLKDSSTEDIMKDFKAVNMALDAKRIPYYITPKVLSVSCSSLIDAPLDEILTLRKMEKIFTGGKPERCHTAMLTVYRVYKRNHLYYGDVELPLFHVRRIDKVPAVDGALGLTFGDQGIGSIILLDRIKEFATDSVIPALTFQGRNTLIPYWLQGYYDVEEAISKQYKQTLSEIYPNKAELKKLKKTAKIFLKNKRQMETSRLRQTLQRADGALNQGVLGGGLDAISSLLGGLDKDKKKEKKSAETEIDEHILDKLNQALLPSIEHHEAYHQIDKSKWKEPKWVATTFKELSENGKEHALEELGAYLTQLTYTEQGSDIWLTKILFFSLNSMMRNQPEFYSSSIILDTMYKLYKGEQVEVRYDLTVDEKIKIYKIFTTLDEAYLKVIAERAYIELFRRPVPEMK
ncbi:MAG: hypothetical protein DSZ29_02975 [Aquificaceae bacterium]|nr:MAG: hypothetical protein DSZ29_02975 [Aquificaceae bacterium]